MKQVLRIAKLSSNAKIPTKGSKLAAGYDLYSAYDYVVPAQGKVLAMTDIQVQVPSGHYGRVAPRSGLAVKNFIDVGAGVVDEDYRGNLGVVLFNFGSEPFKVVKGDRIAQFICEKISYPELEEVENLDDTERGKGGFGSTGTN
ncbi:deoxyuridine 5'-triphosphate nucleotidohydrolase [Trichonephila clavata]|uniref:Deoxyuridine 5'-triphosphate nucleotidohydrolase n=1 Tax=Trichonephila clavata TaxID=2740835 RepID=A0A8X6I3I5_TRICU|nr:deoxyuridine 5'-triphosphate nucleotidohydrolase [Trichonephila clavata]